MKTQKINDFEVTTQLNKTPESGVYSIVSFTGCDDKEALELAKKFDWKKMKQVTQAAK